VEILVVEGIWLNSQPQDHMVQGLAAMAQFALSGPVQLANSRSQTLVHLNFLEINHAGKN
jgi:hypothetical protein